MSDQQAHLPFATIEVLEGMAWTLRDAWLTRRLVRVTLSERCSVPFIVGRISAVSVTGTWATIDGWHVPIGQVRDVAHPTHDEVGQYAHLMHQLRERG
jgi:hypothetical protein